MKGKTSAAHKYVEMERQLKDYMRHKQLPMHMRSRILIYYEFRFQKSYFRENEILDTISEQLRQVSHCILSKQGLFISRPFYRKSTCTHAVNWWRTSYFSATYQSTC